MATVTGSMGGQPIDLDNAATETTLRALLQATIAAGLKNTEALKNMLGKAGLNVDAANAGLADVGTASTRTKAQVDALAETARSTKNIFTSVNEVSSKLMSGTAEASDVLGAFAKNIPGFAGAVFEGLAKIATLQEENMRAYQQITKVGVNFAGSLTDMRTAAAASYLTLGEFTTLMKTNSKVFAMMGGSVDDGAQAFARLSSTLIRSPIGDNLLALGLTTEQVNQGMASYMSMTGGRQKLDAAGSAALLASSAAYMENLDGLSRITGESKDSQQAALDTASKNAAWQTQMQSMSESDRVKAAKGMADALAIGGKGAVDAFQSKIMGIAPDKAGAMFIATQGKVADVIDKSANMVLDSTKNIGDMGGTMKEGMLASREEYSKYSKESLYAIIRQGGPAAEALQSLGINANRINNMDDVAINNMMKKAELDGTQAKEMAQLNKAFKEIGELLWTALSPIITVVTQGLGYLGGWLSEMIKPVTALIKEFPKISSGIALAVVAIGTFAAALIAKSVVSAGTGALGALSGAGAAGKAAGGGIGGAIGGVGRGAGAGMQGLAGGLRAFANPQVLLGATIFAASIAIIGAGIAGAAWLLGKTLPTLAEGLTSLGEIDGLGLLTTAAGVGGLGLALMAFAPFAVFGIPASFALNMLADGVIKLNSVDPARLERVAAAMQKVKDATPSIGQSISAGISGLVSKVTGSSEAPSAPGGETTTGSSAADSINMSTELQRLNTISTEMLRVMKEAADSMKRNVDATKALNRNLYA